MNTNLNIESLLELPTMIKEEFPSDAREIADSLELFSLALDGVYDKVKKNIEKQMCDRQLDKVRRLIDISEKLLDSQELIKNYVDQYYDKDQEDMEETDEIEEQLGVDDEKSSKNIDYNQYTVDSSLAHSLYEDFTHKKVSGFSLLGTKYETKCMSDILIQLCSILASENISLMNSFVDDKTMKGRKVNYFGTKQVVTETGVKNARIPGTDVYVWTNLSSNSIRNLIRKLLKKYDINFNQFYIYLRADYTALHADDKL